MLIARGNVASLTTISQDIQHNQSGIIYELDEQGNMVRVMYYGRNYSLVIEFWHDNHEFWIINQDDGTEIYSVKDGFPYQRQYSNIKNAIWAEDQARIRYPMDIIMNAIREQKASF